MSLHSSGAGQWLRDPEAPVFYLPGGAGRFVATWTSPLPAPSIAAQIFRVMIPTSQLRQLGAPRSQKPVLWVRGVPPGSTVVVDFYRTPSKTPDPTTLPQLPGMYLRSLPLGGSSWLIAVMNFLCFNESYIEHLRRSVFLSLQQTDPGLDVSTGRGVSWFEGADGLRGMAEFSMT